MMQTVSATSIGIIGAGQVGGALARALTRAGFSVIFGVRDPADSRVGDVLAALPGTRALPLDQIADAAQIIVLATPWTAVPSAIAAMGHLRDKVLIDATNPLMMTDGGLALSVGHDGSGGEEVQRLAPDAYVFKTFNQTGFEVMADAAALSAPPVMFVAGDNSLAKPGVMEVVSAAGFEAVPAARAALAYVRSVEGVQTGQTLRVW